MGTWNISLAPDAVAEVLHLQPIQSHPLSPPIPDPLPVSFQTEMHDMSDRQTVESRWTHDQVNPAQPSPCSKNELTSACAIGARSYYLDWHDQCNIHVHWYPHSYTSVHHISPPQSDQDYVHIHVHVWEHHLTMEHLQQLVW